MKWKRKLCLPTIYFKNGVETIQTIFLSWSKIALIQKFSTGRPNPAKSGLPTSLVALW